MTIELLDRYRKLTGNSGVGSVQDAVMERRVTHQQWLTWRRTESVARIRRELVIRFTWSVPTPEAVEAIAAWSPIIDPMAGNGYWPHLLAEAGADVIAFDRIPAGCDLMALILAGEWDPGENPWHSGAVPWYRIERGDAPEVAAANPDRTLLLSWPPHGGVAAETEDAYWRAGGRRLVYIGELTDGYTGDGVFHARLGHPHYCWADHDDPEADEWCKCERGADQRWEMAAEVRLPQWDGVHDGVYLFERKEGL